MFEYNLHIICKVRSLVGYRTFRYRMVVVDRATRAPIIEVQLVMVEGYRRNSARAIVVLVTSHDKQ